MTPPVLHILKEQHCWLSPDRCIFWEEAKALIISDLHFGKTGHFRKAGIAVPTHVYKEDLQRLAAQLQHFKPDQLIIVGDLFHSKANNELDHFKKWRDDFTDITITLIKGNHDILSNNIYTAYDIEVHEKEWSKGSFTFCHDCNDIMEDNDRYVFSGHIHPGIRIAGKARQALQFPCYYFTQHYCVLPAFSKFTGLALISPQKKERVFAIAGDRVISL
jgi:DNA ligase-associated metallophosphoesterase